MVSIKQDNLLEYLYFILIDLYYTMNNFLFLEN